MKKIPYIQEEIDRLKESIAFWKREWRLMEAAEKKAEERIKELEAERDGFRNGQGQLQEINFDLMRTIEKYSLA